MIVTFCTVPWGRQLFGMIGTPHYRRACVGSGGCTVTIYAAGLVRVMEIDAEPTDLDQYSTQRHRVCP